MTSRTLFANVDGSRWGGEVSSATSMDHLAFGSQVRETHAAIDPLGDRGGLGPGMSVSAAVRCARLALRRGKPAAKGP